jgi:uncharacterized membrane protein YqhA
MSENQATKTSSQVTIVVSAVMLLCIYTLFMKAYEIDNWRGFWFSTAHVVIVACGAWFSLRKVA